MDLEIHEILEIIDSQFAGAFTTFWATISQFWLGKKTFSQPSRREGLTSSKMKD